MMHDATLSVTETREYNSVHLENSKHLPENGISVTHDKPAINECFFILKEVPTKRKKKLVLWEQDQKV